MTNVQAPITVKASAACAAWTTNSAATNCGKVTSKSQCARTKRSLKPVTARDASRGPATQAPASWRSVSTLAMVSGALARSSAAMSAQ